MNAKYVFIVVSMVTATAALWLAVALPWWRRSCEAHFLEVAKEHEHLVQAICDYHAEHGMRPERLEDLVPEYVAKVPDSRYLTYCEACLTIFTGLPHTGVSYMWDGPYRGWLVGGDFGNHPLALPMVTARRQGVSGDDLVNARLSEYDRRIARSSANLVHWTGKISYLLSLDRRNEALAECKTAATEHPDWWRAQMGLAVLAPKSESNTAEERFRCWVDAHPAFIHYWYLARYYRDLGRPRDALAALWKGVDYPLEDVDADAGWVPHVFARDAASFACAQNEPELVLAIVRMWSSPRGTYAYRENDLDAFSAAAKLTLGRFDEAQTDLARAIETARVRPLRAENLRQLERAIRLRDRAFVYDLGEEREWQLFPQVD